MWNFDASHAEYAAATVASRASATKCMGHQGGCYRHGLTSDRARLAKRRSGRKRARAAVSSDQSDAGSA
eukprot:5747433-Pyramimonas_sp.AAC.1